MKKYTRSVELDRAKIDEKRRSILATLSTEFPVERHFGKEILVHTEDAIDLSRAPVSLIVAHNDEQLPVGVVEGIKLVGRKLKGILRFGNSIRSSEIWEDVKSGILQNLSVAYSILERKNEGDFVMVTRWQLFEVSLVSVPADPGAKIGRSYHQNTNNRGSKMETNNIFTKENLGIIIDRMESAKGEPMGREYQAAAADWDEVAAVLDPTAPRATGRDRVFVNGLQAWISRSGSDPLRPGIVREDVAYDSHGNEKNNDVDSRGETAYAKRTNTKKYDTSYIRYLVDGPVGISPSELRALQVDSDVAGGYIVSPEQMSNKLVQGLDEQVFFRSLATKYSVPNAVSLGVPVLDNDISDSDWTSELGTGSEDSTMSFGKRELNPHPLAKRIKVSNKLLRASTLNAGDIVQSRLLYKFAVTEEKAFLTGHGNNQPLGVFVASDNGISTSRDVSEGNTTTSITTDGLIEAYHGLSPAYQKNAVWCFHPDAIKQIRKLKDGDGQYIWQAGLIAGAPDKILNRPYFQSEWAPNTFTSGQYVGIVGDFSFYWIADALKMQIQRLIELYAETNQTGFIGRLETDGMPVLQAAFSRVTLA